MLFFRAVLAAEVLEDAFLGPMRVVVEGELRQKRSIGFYVLHHSAIRLLI